MWESNDDVFVLTVDMGGLWELWSNSMMLHDTVMHAKFNTPNWAWSSSTFLLAYSCQSSHALSLVKVHVIDHMWAFSVISGQACDA